MADFTKHRREAIKFAIDFTNTLDEGDSVSSVDEVMVLRRSANTWKDVSDEFGSPAGSLSGSQVQVTLNEALSGDQAAGAYRMRVSVSTANGERLLATPSVEVTAIADESAP